jgi:hypothetical protein
VVIAVLVKLVLINFSERDRESYHGRASLARSKDEAREGHSWLMKEGYRESRLNGQ